MGTLLAKQSSWSVMVHCLLVFSCFTVFQLTNAKPHQQTKDTGTSFFRSAVYNHRAVTPAGPNKPNWDYAKSIIAENLAIYEEQIARAAELDVNIIVFPEDGLIGLNFYRGEIYNYLEHVPDPDIASVNPCNDYSNPTYQPIQYRMSCAAKQYGMWVVVNMGDLQNCTKNENPNCPGDGRFQFNTNIVFNSEGDLVARYHKRNLFYEFQFDMPAAVEHSVFETPYGRMGMFVCFDILFKEPAVDLVEDFGIKHALFPTAWRSIIPSMSGLGFHESWAIRFGVNLLSAEYHLPELDWIGSGIYNGALGATDFYNDYSYMSPGKLVVSQTPIEPVAPPEGIVEVPEVLVSQQNFTSIMESNLYTWLILDDDHGELYLQNQDTYCYLKYKMEQRSDQDIYAFGIFEGQHFDYLNSYIQVCALVRCSGLDNLSCGKPTRNAHTLFNEVHVAGRFSVDYVLPALLVDKGDINKASWDFTLDRDNNGGLISASNMSQPLLSAILYTRDYSRDNNTGFERPPVKVEDIGEFHSFRDLNSSRQGLEVASKSDIQFLSHSSFIPEMISENVDDSTNEGKGPGFIILLACMVALACVGVVVGGVACKRKRHTGYLKICDKN